MGYASNKKNIAYTKSNYTITDVPIKPNDQKWMSFSFPSNTSWGMKSWGRISFGISKDFGRINRNELRWILYGKGLPVEFINNIISGREGNILEGKHLGK